MAEATRTKRSHLHASRRGSRSSLAHAFDVEEEDLILQYHLALPLAQRVFDLQKCTNIVAWESAVSKLENQA